VINNPKVEGIKMTFTVEKIKKNIVGQLYWNNWVNASGVKVEVTNGVTNVINKIIVQ
jgi:hypothetical protein